MNHTAELKFTKELYGKDSSGAIKVWNIGVFDYNTFAIVKITYGKLNGNLAVKDFVVNKGKNKGKSNETTYLQQAISEAESKINKKINSGYRTSIDELGDIKKDSRGNNKPMLAQKFKLGTIEYPAYIQPKLNGVRAEIGLRTKPDGLFGEYEEVYILSREGKDYIVPQQIKDDYIKLITEIPELKEIPLDGEIYIHKEYLQNIVSAIKKNNELTPKLQFWLYDIKCDLEQHERVKKLNEISRNLYLEHIKIVDTRITYGDGYTEVLTNNFINLGYEGGIVRAFKGLYMYGTRSKNLLKVKRHQDKEFLLVDIIPSGNDSYNGHPIGMFVCKNDINDLTFKVTPEATKKERFDYLNYKNQYLGKYITVRFRERTKDNLPFHANGIIRDYE